MSLGHEGRRPTPCTLGRRAEGKMSMLAEEASLSYSVHFIPQITSSSWYVGKYFPPPVFQEKAQRAKDRAREVAMNSCPSAPGRCLACLSEPCGMQRWLPGKTASVIVARQPATPSRHTGDSEAEQGPRAHSIPVGCASPSTVDTALKFSLIHTLVSRKRRG